METELEQEGNDNTWRTADIRIRKTQVLFNRSLLFDFLNIVLSVILCLFVFPLFPEMEQDQEQAQTSTSKTQAQLRIEKSQVVNF